MANFILYLIESGFCLSLLYLMYYLFFRKETYFSFNRLYLVGILILSLVIPLVHITIVVSQKDELEETFEDIGKFRSYYAQFVSMAEGDFYADKYRSYQVAVFEDGFSDASSQNQQFSNNYFDGESSIASISENSVTGSRINYLKIFIVLYLIGVVFFIGRLLVLLIWLGKTIHSNPRQVHEKYKLVLMEKETPPFSFFRYIFVNKDATRLKEFEQVLTHERVHVSQLHSLDLIIAHVISVFQWFNPLVWFLQRALKTTHEYIADSKVVSHGFELFDYQSLLLNQLVSIQSVELVNNFNLISIKKRIAMMTKNKSRFSAKLKALIIIPAAIIAFFLFADMTVKSPVINFSNFSTAKVSNLDGIWVNHSSTFGKLLKFDGGKLSILESEDMNKVIDLNITLKDKTFTIHRHGSSVESIAYELSGSALKVWWNDDEYSIYEKSSFTNSFEALESKPFSSIELPTVSMTRVLEKPQYVYNIYILNDTYYVDGVECTLSNLKETLKARISKFNKLDRPYITTHLLMDKNASMKPVFDLYQVMRESSLLKIAYGTFPEDASKLQYHMTGLPQMLPPIDGFVVDEAEVGENLLIMEPGGNLTKKTSELESFILSHPKYIISYKWADNTKYGDYVAIVNMNFEVCYKLRDDFAMEKYGMNYLELPQHLQKEARKKYPMRVSQSNIDRE